MNIQDKMQEIHHKFGVTEKANYEIQLFVDDLIKKDRAEQLILSGVSQRSELLPEFLMHDLDGKIITSVIGSADVTKEWNEYLGNCG